MRISLRSRLVLALTSALLVASGGAALAGPKSAAPSPYYERNCFWSVTTDPNAVNVAYPDTAANYWLGTIALPPGFSLLIHGRYPHARYASFNLYGPQAEPVAALSDVQIRPDPGSTNPFVAGADRRAAQRGYTVRVLAANPPAHPAANTLYDSYNGQPDRAVEVIYRTYVPDRGTGLDGGVGLPNVSLVSPAGTVSPLPDACAALTTDAPPIGNDTYADADAGALPAGYPAQRTPRWYAFFNLAQAQSDTYFGGTPAAPLAAAVPQTNTGGYFSNRDNAYVSTSIDRSYGPVLVLTGRAPSTPHTSAGQPRMGSGQLRYWSLCTNEPYSTRYVGCAHDGQVAVSPTGEYTFVISSPAARPNNAVPACGVTWLPWGASPRGLLILRNMIPAPDFTQAIQNVRDATDPARWMGPYLPAGHYTTTAAFQAAGCPA